MTYWSGVRLVAGREIRERVRSKVFRVATVVSAIVVAGIVVVPNLGSDRAPTYDVGLVGRTTPALRDAVENVGGAIGGTVRAEAVESVGAAERALKSGALDLAVIDGASLVVDDPVASSRLNNRLRLVVAVSEAVRLQVALEASGLDAERTRAALAQRQLPVRALGKPKVSEGKQVGAFFGVVMLFFFLQQYGSWILVGVAEEKSSRIAEVLLSAVRPRQLVAGKVLGIGTVGLIQAIVVAAVGLVASRSVGTAIVSGVDPFILVAAVGWFVLGFAFYGWAYAAAGSLVSRQSEAQAAGFPIAIPLLASYAAASTALTTSEPSSVLRVLAYLPPTAPLCMPTLAAMGHASATGIALSAAGTLLGALVMARVAGAVYSNAILRTGKKVKWSEALRSG